MVSSLVKVEGAESPLTDNQPLATQSDFGFRLPRLAGAWKSLLGSRVKSLKSQSSIGSEILERAETRQSKKLQSTKVSPHKKGKKKKNYSKLQGHHTRQAVKPQRKDAFATKDKHKNQVDRPRQA